MKFRKKTHALIIDICLQKKKEMLQRILICLFKLQIILILDPGICPFLSYRDTLYYVCLDIFLHISTYIEIEM